MAELHTSDLMTQFKSNPPPDIFSVINTLFNELSDRETIILLVISRVSN